jgi:uncharacterized protein (TIGR02145 family)
MIREKVILFVVLKIKQMKKLKLIIPAILVGIAFFTSCSKDEKAPEPIPVVSTPPPIVSTQIIDVYNPITGKTWMDRNLGASSAAINTSDIAAYGDLYQWGRLKDGHEKRTSPITNTLSTTDVPGHSNFIVNGALPNDWRSPQNNSLWQGLGGINNPCPSGYRLPTLAEWDAERLSWTSNDAAGAFGSPLKLTIGGFRNSISPIPVDEGVRGRYWSSTIGTGYGVLALEFDMNGAFTSTSYSVFREGGACIRCIKD